MQKVFEAINKKAQEYLNNQSVDYGDLTLDAEEQIKEAFISGANAEVISIAPLVIHRRLCSEIVKIAKAHRGMPISDIPEGMELLRFLEVIEGFYPQLKSK